MQIDVDKGMKTIGWTGDEIARLLKKEERKIMHQTRKHVIPTETNAMVIL